MKKYNIAIFGASGYIGLALTQHLYQLGHNISLFVRNKDRVAYLLGADDFNIYTTPIEKQNIMQLSKDLNNIDVIYYLIHSMEKQTENFLKKDNDVAQIVGKASFNAKVKQIIYVGGLGVDDTKHSLSKHLKSRQITAKYLSKYGTPVTEFRMGIVTGVGSASFEMIRTLSTKLPFIPQIPFNHGVCQIIDIQNVLEYLEQALNNHKYFDKIIEVGTKTAYGYDELIVIYARMIKSRNIIVLPLPLLQYIFTEFVIARFISFFTNMPYKLSRPLIEGMKSLAVVENYPIEEVDNENRVRIIDYAESIIKASSYRHEIAFESVWQIPIDLQFFLKQNKDELTFAQYKRFGLYFSSFIVPLKFNDKNIYFNAIKEIIHKSRFEFTKFEEIYLNVVDRLFFREKLYSTSSSLTLVEGSTCRDWRVVAINENSQYITISSQFQKVGFLWFQASLHTEPKTKENYLMLRIFFEPISIKGHIYWKVVKPFHETILKRLYLRVVGITQQKGIKIERD